MKLSKLFLSVVVCGLFVSIVSCGGQATEKTIKDEKLQPFLLGGIYSIHGYGGCKAFFNLVKQQVSSEPGSSKFLKDLTTTYNEVFTFPFGTDDPDEYREGLKEWWEVSNKEEFLTTQKKLLEKGHQASYEQCRKAIDENGGANADINKIDWGKYGIDKEDLAFVKENYAKFSKSGIKAWDIARYVNNVNMGHAAGYINDAESREMLKNAVVEAQKYYSNWKDYYTDFNLGRKFWGGDNSSDFDALAEGILDTTNVYNIYNYATIK